MAFGTSTFPTGSFSFARSGFKFPGAPAPKKATGGIADSLAGLFGGYQQQAAQGGFQGGGGGNPYAGLLGDYLNQMRADAQGASVNDAASRDAMLRRLAVSYGAIPDFASLGISDASKGVLQGALDSNTQALAAKNYAEGTSIKARLDQADKIAQRQIPAQLAARGILRSGQTGYDLGQQALQSKQKNFDVLNEMLGNMEGAISQYNAAEAARQRALADAEMQAKMQAAQDWGGSMGGGGYEMPANNSWLAYGMTPWGAPVNVPQMPDINQSLNQAFKAPKPSVWANLFAKKRGR